jgi:hypothetical protein
MSDKITDSIKETYKEMFHGSLLACILWSRDMETTA